MVELWLTVVIFLLCPHMVGRAREHSEVSFIRALIPFMRVLPSWPNYFPKALLPNTITLGFRISTYEFEGNTNIQSIAGILWANQTDRSCSGKNHFEEPSLSRRAVDGVVSLRRGLLVGQSSWMSSWEHCSNLYLPKFFYSPYGPLLTRVTWNPEPCVVFLLKELLI